MLGSEDANVIVLQSRNFQVPMSGEFHAISFLDEAALNRDQSGDAGQLAPAAGRCSSRESLRRLRRTVAIVLDRSWRTGATSGRMCLARPPRPCVGRHLGNPSDGFAVPVIAQKSLEDKEWSMKFRKRGERSP